MTGRAWAYSLAAAAAIDTVLGAAIFIIVRSAT